MPELFVEVGAEEIPAPYVARALEELPARMTSALGEARLGGTRARAFGTPRRLAVAVDDVAEKQPDRSEDVLGPPKSAAFGPDGKPTPAAIGFAKKCGVEIGDLKIVDSEKGPRVCARREEKGEAAMAILPALVAQVIAGTPFRKTMRWGEGRGPFARPVHWIVCLFGGKVLPVEIAGVRAAAETRGHRFLSPEAFRVTSAADWIDKLRAAHVLVDPAERLSRLREGIARAAKEAGGVVVADPGLEIEVRDLVEEPHALAGSFDPALLGLPREVIVEAMRGHQRYFALEDRPGGTLLPRFVAVANTAEAPDVVRRGNERVLRARLADAKFFFEEDRKKSLRDRVDALAGMVFAKGLGTVREKVDRVARVAHALADLLGARFPAGDRVHIDRAAPLLKADLTTHLVGEFPELQGIVGEKYARAGGEPDAVAIAVREHYQPRTVDGDLPATALGRLFAIADRVDSIASFFSAGSQPTGAADPFGVRKASVAIVRISIGESWHYDLRRLVAAAGRAAVVDAVVEFIVTRLRGVLEAEGIAADVVEAALAASPNDLADAAARARALATFRRRDDFMNLAIAFKRPYNIAKDAARGEFSGDLFDREEERALAAAFGEMRRSFERLVAERAYDKALELVAQTLRAPMDRYFDKVFVMVDDARVRENRLRFLGAVADTLSSLAHFHLLQTEIDVTKGTPAAGPPRGGGGKAEKKAATR